DPPTSSTIAENVTRSRTRKRSQSTEPLGRNQLEVSCRRNRQRCLHNAMPPGVGVVRLALERIVEIRVETAQPAPGAGTQVRRNKKQAPALVLANVHMFMVAAMLETFGAPSQNHVPQGHCRRRTEPRHAAP